MRAHGGPEAHPIDNTYSAPLAIGILFGMGGPCHKLFGWVVRVLKYGEGRYLLSLGGSAEQI